MYILGLFFWGDIVTVTPQGSQSWASLYVINVTLFFEDELNDFNVTCDNLLTKLLVAKTGKHSSRKDFKSYLKELYETLLI